MTLILNAILPTFSIILLGWYCRKKGFPGHNEFWRPAERFIYFMLLPALFFRIAATTEIDLESMWKVPFVIALCVTVMTFWMLATKRLYKVDNPSFTSLHQGAIRFNGYLSIAIIGALYSDPGMALVAVTFGVLVPFINFACIMILAMYGRKAAPLKVMDIVLQVIKNPLLVSSLLGLLFNVSGLHLPYIISETLNILGKAALGFGLLALGAGLKMHALSHARWPSLIANSYKLVVFPVMALVIALLLGMQGLALHVTVVLAALPGASASYFLAKQMGGNAELMSAVIVTQTLASIVTLSIVILSLQAWFPL